MVGWAATIQVREDWPESLSQWVALCWKPGFLFYFFKACAYMPLDKGSSAFPRADHVPGVFLLNPFRASGYWIVWLKDTVWDFSLPQHKPYPQTVHCLVTCCLAAKLFLNWINDCSLLLYLGKTSRPSDIHCNYFSLVSPSVKHNWCVLVLRWVSLYLLIRCPFNILVSLLKGWLRNA